jgi:hypothetical protein
VKDLERQHLSAPYRVHALAPDFELLDVWRFHLGADARQDFAAFVASFWVAIAEIAASPLGRLRVWLGQRLGWDANPHERPIPGCVERSVAARLSSVDAAANRFTSATPSPFSAAAVRPIYLFEDEALYEISNETIHALLHLAWISGPAPSARLAVYVKSRGLASRLYLAAIAPFRYAIVYPALIASVERRFQRRGDAAPDCLGQTP